MIEYDEFEKRLVLKVVYYGPALSGKTTNLLRLHELLAREQRGDLMVLDTKDDRTIYFDLLPFFLQAPSGLKIKLKAYTVPGQVRHDATRKAVLQRADGVVFVADSQLKETTNNVESFQNLERNLKMVGLSFDSTPLVIQYNKRDLPGIVSTEDIDRVWGETGIPVHRACALDGGGVLETFRALLGRLYLGVDEKISLESDHGLSREDFIAQILRPASGDSGEIDLREGGLE